MSIVDTATQADIETAIQTTCLKLALLQQDCRQPSALAC